MIEKEPKSEHITSKYPYVALRIMRPGTEAGGQLCEVKVSLGHSETQNKSQFLKGLDLCFCIFTRCFFRDLLNSLVTVFILFTLDHWYAVLQDVWKVPEASRVFSSIYVILWLLLGSIIFRNIIVAMMGKSREGPTLHKGWWKNWLTGRELSVSRKSGCWNGYFTLFLPLKPASLSGHHHLLTPKGPLGQLLTFRISEMS